MVLAAAQAFPATSPTAVASSVFEGDLKPLLARLPAPLAPTDFIDDGVVHAARYELGRNLFFDPILSGNRNISCGTCHDPAHGTSDGVPLSIGEGGVGQAHERRALEPVPQRVPRNAQALYNIGAREYRHFFHDGRLHGASTHVHGAGFQPLAGERLPEALSPLLARQALFPVVSAVEMAGQSGENPIGTAVARYRLAGDGGAWDLLANRLRGLPAYVQQFKAAFEDVRSAADIDFSHAALALAHFQSRAFESTSSPFDQLLHTGDLSSWSRSQKKGLALFYGKAGCAGCHTGALLTDHDFHSIAMPQIGPGKGHGHDRSYPAESGFRDRLEDEGRYRVTFRPDDRFRFRTPSLRNVALTGPWGHSGAYDDLEHVVRHHADPLPSLDGYHRARAERMLPPLARVLDSRGRGERRVWFEIEPGRRDAFERRRGHVQGHEALRSRIAASNELTPIALDRDEVTALVAFLHTLTDPSAIDRSHLVPERVPSGLEPQPSRSTDRDVRR